MKRILFFAKDHPKLTSAYAQITKELLSRLIQKTDYEFSLLATVGTEQRDSTWKVGDKKIPVYCGISDKVNPKDRIFDLYSKGKFDLLFILLDVWPLDKEIFDKLGDRIFIYPAIDSYPFGQDNIEKLSKCLGVVTHNKWAKEILEKECFLKNILGYIYHGCSNKFVPYGTSKSEILKNYPTTRRSLGADDTSFLVSVVAANQTRKNINIILEGLSTFRQLNPEANLKIYIHTQPNISTGFNIPELCKFYNIGDIVNVPNPVDYFTSKYSQEDLASVMNVSDLVFAGCSAESFGLPQLESMASCTPTINLDWGVSKELQEPFLPELLVKPATYYTYPPKNLRKPLPNPEDIAEKVKLVYDKGREYWFERLYKARIGEQFSWDIIADHFIKSFKLIEKLYDKRCIDVPKIDKSEVKVFK